MNSHKLTLILVAILVIGIVIMYNGLVSKRNAVKNTLRGIDVMLKKHHDLIPNLIKIAKQYMTHEKTLLTDITKLRERLVQPESMDTNKKIEIENQLKANIQEFNISFENYTYLKLKYYF